MDADGAGLLRDVLLNPDDDTPRLIYSDWLDDHGDSDRAEFIRLQIAISKRDAAYAIDEQQNNAAVHGGSVCPEVRRAYRLLNSVAPSLPYYYLGPVYRVWRRGFVEAVRCGQTSFAREAVEVVRDNPVVSIRITDAVRVSGAYHVIWRPYLLDATTDGALTEWHDEVAAAAGIPAEGITQYSGITFDTAEAARAAADEAAMRVALRRIEKQWGQAWMNW